MHLHEFLTKPEVALPIIRKDEDFLEFTERLLDDYLILVSQLDAPASVSTEVGRQSSAIAAFSAEAKKVIRKVLEGHPSEAYGCFESGLDHISHFLASQAVPAVSSGGILPKFYRVRRHIGPSLQREELFHIPFDQRHKVATQRYSIPGLPCLYVSGSVYTCWAEMGCPPLHSLQVAELWIKDGKSVNIVDFSRRPEHLVRCLTPEGEPQYKERDPDMLVNYIVLWPLIALCSIVVQHPEDPFKPEYIMPQMLLQWVTLNNYDGICYFSTHVKFETNYLLSACNLVFPAQELRRKGRCPKLRALFKMTPPYSWELLRSVRPKNPAFSVSAPYQLEIIEGHMDFYNLSEFGMVEIMVNQLAQMIKHRNRDGELELGDVQE